MIQLAPPATAQSPSLPMPHDAVQHWPSHIARQVTDCIFADVRQLVSRSRLVRQHNHALVHRAEVRPLKKLGEGAFSNVQLVEYRGQAFAMKHLRQDLLNRPTEFRQAASELALEAHMLASLSHPHLITLHGWAQNGVASFAQGRNDSFFLLLDPLEETLEDRIEHWKTIQSHGSMQQRQEMYTEQLRVCEQIASVLCYLHENGIIYRDLKPNNVGFHQGQVKLFDLGLSRELPQLNLIQPFQMSGKVGTVRYMAPEVACHQSYNVSADAYSWAMVAYEIFTLQKPFAGYTRAMHENLVCLQGLRPDFALGRGNELFFAGRMQAIIAAAWSQVAHQRPCMATICQQVIQEQQQTQLYLWFSNNNNHNSCNNNNNTHHIQQHPNDFNMLALEPLLYDNSWPRKAPTRSPSDVTDITIMSAESLMYNF